MYKLVAIDLDGTLLNSYGEISSRNKKAIEKTLIKDCNVIIASGRPIASAKSYSDEVGISNYMICGNGSMLYDIQNDNVIYDKSIERRKALQIIKICEDNSIFFNIYTETLTIAKTMKYNVAFYNNENRKLPDSKKTNIKIVNNIYEYVMENPDIKILKITVCDENKVVFNSIIKKLKEIKNIEVLDLQHMARKYIQNGTEDVKVEYFYTEITSSGVNKWEAIEKLAELLQIETKEIMAIGDNMNDKEMIEKSGCGVLMGNAAPYLKEFADIVVSDNNNDGVAEALEKYILNE